MKRKLLGILKYLLFLGLGIFLAWWQFSKMTGQERLQFRDSLRHADYWLLIPVVIMALLSHISRAIRWKILIEPLGYRPSTLNAFYCVMTGYLVNTFVPRAGEIMKCGLLSRYEKIPTNKLIGTILVERAFDLSCYFLLIILTLLIQLKFVTTFIKKKILDASASQSLNSGIKAAGIILLCILLIVLVRWVLKKFAHHRHVKTVKGFQAGMVEGFKTIRHLKKRRLFLGHTLFIWLMYLMQIYVGFSALSATSGLSIVHACSVLSLATLGMIVSPGGIGAFPLAVQEVLYIYGIDNISFGWLMWGVTTSIVVVGGMLSFMLLLYKNKTNEAKRAN